MSIQQSSVAALRPYCGGFSFLFKNKKKNIRRSWIGHTVRHKEFVVNIHKGAISKEKKAVGRRRQYLKQVARNTRADSYTAMKRMACYNSRWKAANQSKDLRLRRRRSNCLCRRTSTSIWISHQLSGRVILKTFIYNTVKHICFDKIKESQILNYS